MKSGIIRLFAITALLLLAGVSNALGDSPPVPTGHLAGGSIVFPLIRMLGALALVLALFGGALWLLKNWERCVGRRGPLTKLRILEVKSLGHRQALYVVGYEQQRLLVAASPAGVTMLTCLPAGDEEPSENVVVSHAKFTDVLLHALHRK